jgi:demethylmenaquinone methyltransferase / 2-methoxy-6-polyprenyl-1,4-benzoquinol methylase
MSNNKTQFGFTEIDENEKTEKVKGVFNSVSSNYDLMNDLMSFGLHRLWKKSFIESASLKDNAKILDIAAGTADLSLAFAKKNKTYSIFHTDINSNMLEEGRKKLFNHGVILPSVACDCEALPYSDNYFDCVTIGFGLRNMTHKETALKEVYRVLSPGGKLLILEFSKVWKPLEKIYDIFSFKIIPRLGEIISKDKKSYQYLVESIRVHPNQEELKKIMEKTGFFNVSYNNLSAGIAAIHKGYKV